MAEMRVTARSSASLNPLAVRGTALPPNVLLAAKLVTLVFFVEGLWRLTDPYVPFIGFLDDLASPEVFQRTLQAIWLTAAAALFLNRCVRISCAVLGGTLLLAQIASSAYLTNNKLFTALLLLLIALSDRMTVSTLIRAQLVLLYFWAGLNKLLDQNWRSGAFFDVLNSVEHYGVVYRALEAHLPSMVLPIALSWIVIATELFLAVAFATRSLVFVGILVVVLYHSSLLFVTGSTFTMFWFALLASCLALLEWPALRPSVHYGATGYLARFSRLLRRLDVGAFEWHPERGSSVRLVIGDRVFVDRDAFARMLLYHPTLYFIFYALVAVPQPDRRWAALVAFGVVGYAVLLRKKLALRLQVET
jgi:hypothetical protein